ncbi:polyprenyl synthetase family protein [Magnetospira sp. QH-2]|uniref:polyprenyl synthetase family protein n=1 Tax=Magnetospira sp. (strain QH-2) TaxID=1288970 RepID=UPI0003E80EBB|nr:farnesyl diphosphate synthase [Magnetospira sp. QH-2]CCQ74145.1 Putative Geranyltranstransferase (Farnesyl-diphosphate synthase) (FPP synthase) [Magnetospira sp. QH-2]
MTLSQTMVQTADAIEQMLDHLLAAADGPENRLIEAMRYATLGGGKRIRPFLAVQGAKLFNVSERSALRTGAAIEMVHCYSLVHDDLPAMDDDDLRRGRPTCHKQYDEATAILVGDALLTQAFEVLADEDTHSDPAVRAALVVALARASGVEGMVGGQMIDLWAEDNDLDIPAITRLQRMKTGALIRVSCESGAILGKAPEAARQALIAYAHDLGLAFQIADDLLDETGDEAAVGKRVHKDADAGKATFVSLLGIGRAREQADMLADQAAKHLEMFGEKADPLRDLARFVVERST